MNIALPVKETIKRVWRNHVEYALTHRLEFRFLEQFVNSPHIDRLTKKQGLRTVEPVMNQFERAKRERVVRDLPIEMIYVHLFAPVDALMKMHRNDKFKFTGKILEMIFETSWRALGR